MKIATTTAPDFATLREQLSCYDAGYELLKLERQRDIYATHYQRLNDVLRLDDEGYEVTITLRSHSRTMTLTAAEADNCFDITEMYAILSKRLNQLQQAILTSQEALATGQFDHQGTDSPAMAQALALCLPAAPAPAEAPSLTPPAATRAA